MQKQSFEEMVKESERIAQEQAQNDLQSGTGTSQNSGKTMGAGSIVAGILVVVYFMAAVIVMAVFAKIKPAITVATLGSIFLMFGIIGVTQTKITWDSWPILIFPAVGLALVVLPIADMLHKNKTGETIFTTEFIAAAGGGVFFLAGILMLIMPPLARKAKLKVCTAHVTARCISLEKRYTHSKHGSRPVYAPKWQYSINGEEFEQQENSYTNVNVPNVGDEMEILVNPDNPTQIYRENRGTAILGVVMGVMFVAVSSLTIYAVFFMQ